MDWARYANPIASPIVAYSERSAPDPTTGAPGTLRKEWRVRSVQDFAPKQLVAAWGSDWKRYKPFATHVLEMRYIRRGVEEPWTPFQSANSREQVLEYVDGDAIALDPTLKRIEEVREQHAAKTRAEQEEHQKKIVAAEERRYHKKRSEQAFRRLAQSKDSVLTDKWTRYIQEHAHDLAYRARVVNDPVFMQHYTAVLDAETMPAKRKALKAFLKYVS